jgi:heptaprenyl diphosphate synthase
MFDFWSSVPRVREGLGRVRARLLAQADALPKDLRAELEPLFRREGKALRAGLILLASREDAPCDKVESAAAAVELLHLATLVHDDIVDQAAMRRGEPALYRVLGPQKAVLYGDLLFAAAFRSVSRDVGPDSARSLADLVTVMAASEIQQLGDRFQLPLSPRRILRRTLGKTALLFSLSLYVGAVEGGRSPESARWLRRAGYSMGMAFQIQDDLLDWTGDAAALGKPVHEDLASGIYSWPAGVAWRLDPRLTADELAAAAKGKLSADEVRRRWEHRGVFALVEHDVALYASRARSDLDKALGPGAERAVWEGFMTRLLGRRF